MALAVGDGAPPSNDLALAIEAIVPSMQIGDGGFLGFSSSVPGISFLMDCTPTRSKPTASCQITPSPLLRETSSLSKPDAAAPVAAASDSESDEAFMAKARARSGDIRACGGAIQRAYASAAVACGVAKDRDVKRHKDLRVALTLQREAKAAMPKAKPKAKPKAAKPKAKPKAKAAAGCKRVTHTYVTYIFFNCCFRHRAQSTVLP